MTSSPIRLDLFKFSRKPIWILLAVFLTILLKGAVFLAAKFEPFGGGIENGYAFLARSARYSFFLGSFLLCLMAGATLSGEYASGILRMHLSRPVSRSAYFLQRSLFLVLVAFLLILLDGTIGTLVGWGGFGFFDVADTQLQGPRFGAAAMAWSSLQVYLLSFLGMAALASLGLLISVILRTPVAAIGTAAGLFFFMQGVQHIFRDPARSFMATFYIQDHVNHLAQRAQGIAEYQPPDYLFKAILVPLVYIILTNAIGLVLFKRMDVLE